MVPPSRSLGCLQIMVVMMMMAAMAVVVVVMMNNSALQENSDLPGSYGGGMAYVKVRGAGKEIFKTRGFGGTRGTPVWDSFNGTTAESWGSHFEVRPLAM